MFSALAKFFNLLENPEHPCLGPHIWMLNATGLMFSETKTLKTRLKLLSYYLTVLFFFTQYIRCAMSFSVASVLLILQYAPFHMGVPKVILFQKDYKEWMRLITYISEVEIKQRSMRAEKTERIMKQYILRSRIVTYVFSVLATLSTISIFSEPYRKYEIDANGTRLYWVVLDGYTSFEKEPPGFHFSMAIQTVVGFIMAAYICIWDMMAVSIMMFFAGQLKISRWYCSNAIDLESRVNSQRNIAECHRFHTRLVSYQKKFNRLISRVMFMYLIVVSINLGMNIMQIAEAETDVQQLTSSCWFVGAILTQLLMLYLHSNEVTVQSERVSYGPFMSKWPEADKSLQKQIALLSHTTGTRLVFSAGPVNEMSLETFVTILRRSYSFFTLLKKTN